MRSILILGAGRSSIALIDYLVKHAPIEQWQITVADITDELALAKTKGRQNTHALGFDLNNDAQRHTLIAQCDIVISMLPPALHGMVAKDCIQFKKNLVTPSYISDAMRQLDHDVMQNDLIFMNEMGLDPGIDHLSSMQLIEKLKAEGNSITGYQSHCGGLVAPESDDNAWHYKFTWNPRNVILAGQGDGGIHYLQQGKKVHLSYSELFSNPFKINIEGYGEFESYPNRDSLKYIEAYGLQEVETMYRGTLRIPPFCTGWNLLIQLGFTQDITIPTQQFVTQLNAQLKILAIKPGTTTHILVEQTGVLKHLKTYHADSINPAKFLQTLLETAWQMNPTDKDMIVMIHQLTYINSAGKSKQLQSSLVYVGTNADHTAMAITVGLPVAIIARMILNGRISKRGVLMPTHKEIYEPVLTELKEYGITFVENITDLN